MKKTPGMRMREGSPKTPHFNDTDLSRIISVDGKTCAINKATAEEFDQYIYDILGQMYSKQGHITNRYETCFDYDWKYPYYRIIAMNELYALNLMRVKGGKPAVPLFVEENAHV